MVAQELKQAPVLDLTQVVKSMWIVSDGRILNDYVTGGSSSLRSASVPVRTLDPDDPQERILIKFATDSIRTMLPESPANWRVEGKLKRFEDPTEWTGNEEGAVPEQVDACIELVWWPRPRIPELEQLAAKQK